MVEESWGAILIFVSRYSNPENVKKKKKKKAVLISSVLSHSIINRNHFLDSKICGYFSTSKQAFSSTVDTSGVSSISVPFSHYLPGDSIRSQESEGSVPRTARASPQPSESSRKPDCLTCASDLPVIHTGRPMTHPTIIGFH